MVLVTRRPLNPGSRGQQIVKIDDLNKNPKKPKGLIVSLRKRCSGRNAYGRITVRHRGGGAKRLYRLVDFKRDMVGVPSVVSDFHYDPYRNLSLALLQYKNGAKSYILKPEGIVRGDVLASGDSAEAKVGNSLKLDQIPVGFMVHNIELEPGRGGIIARSAGVGARLVSKEGGKALLKMPSGELRYVNLACRATIGVLSNAEFKNATLGKAGRTRHRGFRPTVRGIAMNPVDHVRGGGEGRSKSGSGPCSPTGTCKLGVRTRRERRKGVILKRRG